jgi:hypothetical protein
MTSLNNDSAEDDGDYHWLSWTDNSKWKSQYT